MLGRPCRLLRKLFGSSQVQSNGRCTISLNFPQHSECRIAAKQTMEHSVEKEASHLDWEHNIAREIRHLSWPIVISLLSFAMTTLVDTIFVSRMGSSALAGVGLGSTYVFTLACFSFGIARGIKVLTSQAHGAGEETVGFVGAGLALCVGLGFVTAVLGIFGTDLLRWISATEASGLAAASYAAIRIASAPLMLVSTAIREARYGVGDSKSPMYASLLANGVNIVFDYLFIFVLGWGVEGAAWASVLSVLVQASFMLLVQRTHGFGLKGGVDWDKLKAIAIVGWPTGVQFSIEVGAFALLASMLAALSEVEMAAHQIALQVIHFTFLPALAVSEAASVLPGQAVGALRTALVMKVAKASMWLAFAYAVFCTLVLGLGAQFIADAFTDDSDLARAAAQLLLVAAIFQIADAGNAIARGVLRGTGDVKYTAVVGVICSWVCTPPLTWLLGYQLGLGALGGWIGLCVEITVCTLILWRRLKCGHWKNAADATRTQAALSVA